MVSGHFPPQRGHGGAGGISQRPPNLSSFNRRGGGRERGLSPWGSPLAGTETGGGFVPKEPCLSPPVLRQSGGGCCCVGCGRGADRALWLGGPRLSRSRPPHRRMCWLEVCGWESYPRVPSREESGFCLRQSLSFDSPSHTHSLTHSLLCSATVGFPCRGRPSKRDLGSLPKSSLALLGVALSQACCVRPVPESEARFFWEAEVSLTPAQRRPGKSWAWWVLPRESRRVGIPVSLSHPGRGRLSQLLWAKQPLDSGARAVAEAPVGFAP